MPLHSILNKFRTFAIGLFAGFIPSADNDLEDGSLNTLKDGSGNDLTD